MWEGGDWSHPATMTLISTLGVVSDIQSVFCGLANLGNTCYLNSVLQCLLPLTAFQEILKESKLPPNSLVGVSLKLVSVMKDRSKVCADPSEFFSKFVESNPQFASGNQEDCQAKFILNLNKRLPVCNSCVVLWETITLLWPLPYSV